MSKHSEPLPSEEVFGRKMVTINTVFFGAIPMVVLWYMWFKTSETGGDDWAAQYHSLIHWAAVFATVVEILGIAGLVWRKFTFGKAE